MSQSSVKVLWHSSYYMLVRMRYLQEIYGILKDECMGSLVSETNGMTVACVVKFSLTSKISHIAG